VKEIPLTKGLIALVDDCDYLDISRYKWGAGSRNGGYVAKRKQDGKHIYMHREVLHAPDGLVVDHINHNTLDNRRSNLRLCTQKQNIRNSQLSIRNKSGYKGVHKAWGHTTWRASIEVNNRYISLGYYDTPEAAARAYDDAAVKYFGNFAHTNSDIHVDILE
jgi:hypothetical protein